MLIKGNSRWIRREPWLKERSKGGWSEGGLWLEGQGDFAVRKRGGERRTRGWRIW